MGHTYQTVQWNPNKRRYDLVIAAGVAVFLGAFIGISAATDPEATAETLLIRGLGAAAVTLLHVILAIGPLARLDRRFLPVLYNRRHLGVTMASLALFHGAFATVQFHAFGDTNPIVSLFTANERVDSLAHFPFQPLGAIALSILLLMAATSHDFWLANLTAPVWKALHMLVYLAYGLVVAHVALGTLQAETSPVLAGLVGAGALSLIVLHALSAGRDRADEEAQLREGSGAINACAASEVPEGRAKVVVIGGERVAIFRDRGRLSALSGVCQHQNGPLGEGRVVDGLVVCPWHGYQYKPDCGCSPEPFHETVPTFRVEVRDGRVLVDPRPLPLGTITEPVPVEGGAE